MRKVYARFICVVAIFMLPVFVFSQTNWETGLTLGYTNYLGDLVVPNFTFNNSHPAAQFYLRKNFDANHAYRLNFMYGKISGSDANYERNAARGASFENTIWEVTSMAEVDLFGKKRFPKKGQFKKAKTPYLLLGIGLMHGRPEVTYDNENVDESIEYPEWHVSIPAGIGFKMDINENMFVGAEFISRVTLSDNLDGVQLSGNAYRNDSVISGGLSIGFRFWKNPAVVSMTIQSENGEVEKEEEKKEKRKKEKKNKTEKKKGKKKKE